MTQPVPNTFVELIFSVGDGATPEAFTKLGIAMVSRNWNQSASTVSDTVPDEEDEDAVVFESKQASTKSATARGQGKVGKDKVATCQALLGVKKNYKVHQVGVGDWVGPFILTAFNQTGERNKYWEGDVTLESAGNLAFTAEVP